MNYRLNVFMGDGILIRLPLNAANFLALGLPGPPAFPGKTPILSSHSLISVCCLFHSYLPRFSSWNPFEKSWISNSIPTVPLENCWNGKWKTLNSPSIQLNLLSPLDMLRIYQHSHPEPCSRTISLCRYLHQFINCSSFI